MLEAGVRLPTRGASILLPQGISGVVVPGTGLFPAAGYIEYRWPARWMVRAMKIWESSGNPAVLSQVSISIIDEQKVCMTADGQGAQDQAGCLTFGGGPSGFGGPCNVFGPRAYSLQRIVQPNDIWKFRWANASREQVTVFLEFYLAVVK